MTDREEFLEIFRTHVTRPGSEKLLDWMDSKTDFFSAPASTRFHGACDGGLCAHSLNVYRVLHGTFFTPDEDSEETFAICALLHDLCKANFYKKGTRNVKNEATGQWEKVPSYSVEDMFPYGPRPADKNRARPGAGGARQRSQPPHPGGQYQAQTQNQMQNQYQRRNQNQIQPSLPSAHGICYFCHALRCASGSRPPLSPPRPGAGGSPPTCGRSRRGPLP